MRNTTCGKRSELNQELRFIFPALPMVNLAAGVGMSRAMRGVISGGARERKYTEDDGGSAKTQRCVCVCVCIVMGPVRLTITKPLKNNCHILT